MESHRIRTLDMGWCSEQRDKQMHARFEKGRRECSRQRKGEVREADKVEVTTGLIAGKLRRLRAARLDHFFQVLQSGTGCVDRDAR